MGIPLNLLIVAGVAGASLSFAACGDDIVPVEPCWDGEQMSNHMGCQAAITFAARDTAGLVATPDEVDRYHERWVRAGEVEPILSNRIPQRYRNVGYPDVGIRTRNQKVIAAWNRADLITGDRAFDTIISQIHPRTLSPYGGYDIGDGVYAFTVDVEVLINEELFAQLLLPTMSFVDEPYHNHKDDGTWHWQSASSGTGSDDDTAVIDFTFGWGDCFVACDGLHDLRAIVPTTGEAAMVYDLGGDPLPQGVQLAPATIPPE